VKPSGDDVAAITRIIADHLVDSICGSTLLCAEQRHDVGLASPLLSYA
jgi:hypothetical protein